MNIKSLRPVMVPLCRSILAVFLLAGPAYGQSSDPENFSISLGVFVADRDTETTIGDGTGNPGTEVDLEGDLGLSRSDSVFRIDGYYKFNEKHRIDFSWFDLSRSSSKDIERDIEWNDSVFPIDTTVVSVFDLGIYKLAYTWSFFHDEKNFLGVTAGLYVADSSTTLLAETLGEREVTSVTAPLPVFGLRGQYYLSEKWSLRASGEFFLFEYESWDGDLMDLYAGVDYQVSDRLALGAGFNAVTFDLGVAKENFSGNVDWGYQGAMIFLRGSF